MSKDVKKEKVKHPKVDDKLLAKAKEAQSALEAYFKKHELDPLKDHTKSKKHGEKVKALLAVVNSTRDKIKDVTPPEQHHKKSEDKKSKGGEKPAKEKSEKKATRNVAAKYDYPLVDGREMTSQEKKKYRVKMRSGKDADTAKPAKPAKTGKPEVKESKSDKKSAKVDKSKSGKKDKKKDKKKARNED